MSDASAAGQGQAHSASNLLSPPRWRRPTPCADHESLRRLWPQVLEAVARRSKVAWVMIGPNVQLLGAEHGHVQLGFNNSALRDAFAGSSREEVLRDALREVTGSHWGIRTVVLSLPSSAPAAVVPAPDPARAFKIVRLKSGKLHVTADGIKTACGTLIPEHATTTQPTLQWYLHTNCYNCAHRLWPQHGPREYLQPCDGRDFPPRRKCPHGTAPESCFTCTPVPKGLPNWPCPNGCTEPRDHDPRQRTPRCAVHPPRHPVDPDGRCIEQCESTESVLHRANPKLFLDLADSAMTTCYHCGEPVCIQCQSAPVEDALAFCTACEQRL